MLGKIKEIFSFKCPFWRECAFYQPNSTCTEGDWDFCGEFRARMKKIYWIIGLSFGTGFSNTHLASAIKDIKEDLPHARLILQKEIAESEIKFREPNQPIYIISEHRQPRKYLDTYEVLSQAKKICGNDKVILVAHPDHLFRALKQAKDIGLNVISWRTLYLRDIPYDSSSKQWWTRNKLLFAVWNLMALIWWMVYSKIKRTPRKGG